MTRAKPKVLLVETGGSIAVEARHSLDLVEYSDYGRRLRADELLALFPEVMAVADVECVCFRRIGSSALTPEDWIALAVKLEEVAKADSSLSGIVVMHGTASLEETAYFLHLTVRLTIPIVVVGALRPANGLGTDAGSNLLNAVRVAMAPQSVGLGVLVVLNGEVHSARDVTKASNWKLQAFQGVDFGALGYVDPDGHVAVHRKSTRRGAPDTEFEVDRLLELPRVDIVYSYVGADAVFVRAAVACGAKGLVVVGNAPGRVLTSQRDALLSASHQGVLVVLASRAASGRVIPRKRDVDLGLVCADNLNAQKARILAMLALTRTTDRSDIQRMFSEY